MLLSRDSRDPAAAGRLIGCMLVLALAWPIGKVAQVDPAALLDPANLKVAGGFVASFWPLAHDTFFLGLLRDAVLQTLAIATVGTLLALLIAIPLAVGSTAALSVSAIGPAPRAIWRPAVRQAVKALTLFLRGIPELVWALLFVRVFGLGPSAAVLALALTYGGMLAKVFAEILDSVDRGPARAILAAGGSRTAALVYGLLPNAVPELVSYSIYRWECALRAAVVMGLVGAGGMGQLMDQSMKAFNGGEVASILTAFLLLVLAADALSNLLRRWMDAPPDALHKRIVSGWVLALAGALVCVSAWRMIGLDLGALFGAHAGSDIARFLGEFLPPAHDLPLLGKIASGSLETLATSLVGTVLAACLAAVLALPAAGRCGAVLKAITRFALNLLRAVPELVWATITVLAVGLGPFAGALALALHTCGVLGRLYAEALENAPPAGEAALRTSGAPRSLAFLYGALPQVAPQWLAYTLYRWEINIRMAAVMGFVGAGGLGQALYYELSLFRLGNACAIILAMLLLALLVDHASAMLRWRLG
ncbi:phosphonate ABC transporter, permease protein PhnE [Niveibacterium sp. 24ML]|uniref:phosphonate ABC transporter, permease protein PhnE n=1 Tax=Niveibacterium sp. 24ML TaxID=2985512 RepID=UPI00226FA47C|nr:phosphonate ABC transporter, permease protein PhnE [Niveibacterium sp. 24ML]MCX9156739.1 phosphonate ABC transporter, permease protein PhnE [Niveibacterium sp. 24ML]